MGRIDAGDYDPFTDGKAVFVIRCAVDADDPEVANHGGEGHDPDKCPFCKQKNKPTETDAIVHFRNDEGSDIETDARKLLGLQKGQEVIVTGSAIVDKLEYLTIDADGIFVKG